MTKKAMSEKPWFEFRQEFPCSCDVATGSVLEAIELLPAIVDNPAKPVVYYLRCSRIDIFYAHLAITPIDGINIKIEEYLGYSDWEWSLELRSENVTAIIHSEGL